MIGRAREEAKAPAAQPAKSAAKESPAKPAPVQS
jgi:hypothetical protein